MQVRLSNRPVAWGPERYTSPGQIEAAHEIQADSREMILAEWKKLSDDLMRLDSF